MNLIEINLQDKLNKLKINKKKLIKYLIIFLFINILKNGY